MSHSMPDNRFTKSSQIEFVAAAATIALTTRAVVCTDASNYTITLPAACEMEPGTVVTVAAAAHVSQTYTVTIAETRPGVHPLSTSISGTTYFRVLVSDGLSWHIA